MTETVRQGEKDKAVVELRLRESMESLVLSVTDNGFTEQLEGKLSRIKNMRAGIIALTIIVGAIPTLILFPTLFLAATSSIQEILSIQPLSGSSSDTNMSPRMLASCLICFSVFVFTCASSWSHLDRLRPKR